MSQRGGRGGRGGGGDRGGYRGGGDRGGFRGGDREDSEAETEVVVGSAPLEVEALEVEAAVAGKITIIWHASVHSTSFSIFSPSGGGQPQLDSRLTDRSEDALVASLRGLTLQGDEIPLRPGFGTLGRPITLRTNFFPVRIPKGPIYEYDIAITPVAGTANRRVKRRIFQLAEQTNDWAAAGLRGTVAHDHSAKLVSAKKLKQPLIIRVPWSEEGEPPNGKEYVLAIKFVQNIDTSALSQYIRGQPQYKDYDIMPILSALNLVLAAHPTSSHGGGVMVGRNRFFFPNAMPPSDLGGGLQAFRGFYSSVRPTHNQLMVNVNVCTTAFYTPGNLMHSLNAFMDASFSARPNAFVKGVRVKTTHLGYKKTIKGISNYTARTYKFPCEELGGEVTVEEYFRRKYRIRLNHPDKPLVDVGGQKSNLLPAEVCEILPNQPFKGKLLEEHTTAMIRVAARTPNVNGADIVGPGLNNLGFRQASSVMQAFGVQVGTEMAVVPGRILTPPGVLYARGTPQVDERASWNLRNVKFAKGGTLSAWAVLVIKDGHDRDEFKDNRDPELRSTIEGFVNMCKTSGMSVLEMPKDIVTARLPPGGRQDPIREKAIAEIQNTIKQLRAKPKFLFVILSSGDKHVYSGLKHLCDVYLDIPTVCVHSSKIRKERGQLQYFANVALKVNMKCGGVNHGLDQASMAWLKEASTMLVGIDVTHPGPGSAKGTPSVAAVVASVDSYFAQYPASMELQESKKEMVTNLAKMMYERLLLFSSRNSNKLPQRVLVYRDGVSEGQFHIVVNEELPAIRAAFAKFNRPGAPYNPLLTIVICGKRHHTRFYPTSAENADDKGNPKAGTVVDRGVTAVYNFDFFLQAHGGLQGTTKPTHYYVVHDDMKLDADRLQKLTNDVSYMFARATKAVSLVSPAYYADLACERGRCYIHKLLQGITTVNTNSTDAEQQIYNEATRLWGGGVAGLQLKDSMYYL
ncbi:hypothetical protein VNI00_012342 [Paramarasmius palmivorus]|uniref:Piwi-domain-containing protein n=1 Tax=Paramarasmius palmivorus TaxID=297713 RepID=A0AAW0C6D3_9AGAR